ncbi:hypothetical protein CLOSTMETH_00814 [[Clostridium] methylpentosum DSM 5476]|uniref:Uncharacterized protein n=1 Tax=[Clostridium] methylpentosum DSM 5476 TaxID=537013 RepID=C0EAF9_9FIRM|nr:hypothetical protein CLOSTMETH_00814 [[Clostridium] methylpentosum DSM 5476]
MPFTFSLSPAEPKDFLIEKRTGKTPANISAGRGFKKEESF